MLNFYSTPIVVEINIVIMIVTYLSIIYYTLHFCIIEIDVRNNILILFSVYFILVFEYFF